MIALTFTFTNISGYQVMMEKQFCKGGYKVGPYKTISECNDFTNMTTAKFFMYQRQEHCSADGCMCYGAFDCVTQLTNIAYNIYAINP